LANGKLTPVGACAYKKYMDQQIPKRLAMGLAAKGINMKQAGLAAGLSSTYVRNVIRRGRGKFELLEKVAEANGLSWPWLRTGSGEMDRPPSYRKLLERASRRLPTPELATEKSELAVNILVNRDALVHAFRMFGASEDQANKAVELVSELARGVES
jgi:hypothetical protein